MLLSAGLARGPGGVAFATGLHVGRLAGMGWKRPGFHPGAWRRMKGRLGNEDIHPKWGVGRPRVDRRMAMPGRAMLSFLLLFRLFLLLFLLLLHIAAFGFRLGFDVAADLHLGLAGWLLVFAVLMLISPGCGRQQGCGDEGRAERGWKKGF